MRSLYRAPRRIVGYSRAGVGARGIFGMRNFLQATEMSLANGKIQDVIRTRCAGSYCNALPPKRSDYMYIWRWRAQKGNPPPPPILHRAVKFSILSASSVFPPYAGDASRIYVHEGCAISFLALFHSSVPYRRVRILKRIEAPRVFPQPRTSSQFDTLQIIGAPINRRAKLDLTACKTS